MPGGVAGVPPTMEAPYADVRPAWAYTCGCKSRHELVTVSEVNRNCTRATECGKEAWSINREPMNKNRIEGAIKQSEWAKNHEALVTKARWRRCGGCAMKVCVLTWGDLALWVKARRSCRSEKSAKVVVVRVGGRVGAAKRTKDPTRVSKPRTWRCQRSCVRCRSNAGG
jgi:hypothetical protein